MSKAASFSPKRDIPYLAAAISAVLFAYSGSLLLGWIGWIIGGLLGVLVSVSVLYASSQYAGTAKERKPWIMTGLVILMTFSPIINGTAVYFELSTEIWDVWRGVVAVAWGILPDVAGAVAGFVAGKGMVKADDPAKSEPEAKPERKPRKKAPVSAAPMIACKYGCGFERATQAAMNPHLGACKNNPANMPVRVDLGAK